MCVCVLCVCERIWSCIIPVYQIIWMIDAHCVCMCMGICVCLCVGDWVCVENRGAAPVFLKSVDAAGVE